MENKRNIEIRKRLKEKRTNLQKLSKACEKIVARFSKFE